MTRAVGFIGQKSRPLRGAIGGNHENYNPLTTGDSVRLVVMSHPRFDARPNFFLSGQDHYHHSRPRARRHGGYAGQSDDPFLAEIYSRKPQLRQRVYAGGGGRKAANHIYRSSRPDGLSIANPGVGMVSAAVLGESGVLYDLDKFFYLGSPYSSYHPIFLTRKQAGLSSIRNSGPPPESGSAANRWVFQPIMKDACLLIFSVSRTRNSSRVIQALRLTRR